MRVEIFQAHVLEGIGEERKGGGQSAFPKHGHWKIA